MAGLGNLAASEAPVPCAGGDRQPELSRLALAFKITGIFEFSPEEQLRGAGDALPAPRCSQLEQQALGGFRAKILAPFLPLSIPEHPLQPGRAAGHRQVVTFADKIELPEK